MTKETRYDALHNEGGEGYNPHRTNREAEQAQREASETPDAYTIRRRAELAYLSAKEMYGADSQECREAKDEYLRVAGELTAANDAPTTEWTREETIKRREEYNRLGRMGYSPVRMIERLGFRRGELAAAVKAHGL